MLERCTCEMFTIARLPRVASAEGIQSTIAAAGDDLAGLMSGPPALIVTSRPTSL
jgi:hypothetical protein